MNPNTLDRLYRFIQNAVKCIKHHDDEGNENSLEYRLAKEGNQILKELRKEKI